MPPFLHAVIAGKFSVPLPAIGATSRYSPMGENLTTALSDEPKPVKRFPE